MFTNSITILLKFIFRYRIVTMLPHIAEEIPPIPIAIIPITAESAEIPFEVLQRVMSRIINEVKGVNRVMYDLTSKPPGTIEFE